MNKEDIVQRGQTFLESFKEDMKSYHPSQIFNADQTGIQKELYGARSLAFEGEKVINEAIFYIELICL